MLMLLIIITADDNGRGVHMMTTCPNVVNPNVMGFATTRRDVTNFKLKARVVKMKKKTGT